jgi:hypothetical protein
MNPDTPDNNPNVVWTVFGVGLPHAMVLDCTIIRR